MSLHVPAPDDGHHSDFTQALRDAGVVWAGLAALGIGFGVLVTSHGLPWWLAPVISATVFAGSVEFILVGMLAASAPVAAVAVTTFLINSRHLFYGLSFPLHRVRGRYRKAYSVFALCDEAFALLERFGRDGFQIFLGLRQGGISQLVPHVQRYRKAWQEAGHPGNGGVYIRLPVYVADTVEQALADTEWSITEYFRKRGTLSSRVLASVGRGMNSELNERPDGGTPITWDELVEERIIIGSVQTVTERLRELQDVLGIDGILAEINSGGQIPAEGVKRSLRLLCDEVMPTFK